MPLLARKLLFGLGLNCCKNRWLVADHTLEQWITVNSVIRNKSCTCSKEAGISLHKLCVERCQWGPSLAVVLHSWATCLHYLYLSAKSESMLQIKDKCYRICKRCICLGQMESIHLLQFAPLYRWAELPARLATAKQPQKNPPICCRKPSAHKEAQLEVHRMLVKGCLRGMQVTYKRLQTHWNQGRKHLWGSLRSRGELKTSDVLRVMKFLKEVYG